MKTVLIPAYQPDDQLIKLCQELHSHGITVLIVDDGSGPDYDRVFEQAGAYGQVLRYARNRGKGGALKYGMSKLLEVYPDCPYFITADSDGQHRVGDILRVAEELERGAEFVLTVRQLGRGIPLRSKIGNNLSRWIYTILTGHFFTDNQSGLRGFNTQHIRWLLKVRGEKYDYEMNMLYYADKQRIQITTIPIDAVYIDGNKSSHFDPIADTLRIYKRLFSSAWATFGCALLAELSVILCSILLGHRFLHIWLPSVGVGAAGLNILLNRFVAFRNVRYQDGLRTLIWNIMRYTVYLGGCVLLSQAGFPLLIAFNLTAAVGVVAEYWIHKANYHVRYQDIKVRR